MADPYLNAKYQRGLAMLAGEDPSMGLKRAQEAQNFDAQQKVKAAFAGSGGQIDDELISEMIKLQPDVAMQLMDIRNKTRQQDRLERQQEMFAGGLGELSDTQLISLAATNPQTAKAVELEIERRDRTPASGGMGGGNVPEYIPDTQDAITMPANLSREQQREWNARLADKQLDEQFPTPAQKAQLMEVETLKNKKTQFVSDANREYQRVSQLLGHEGFETSVGWKGYTGAGGMSWLNPWADETVEGEPIPSSGTDAAGFQELYKQIKSGAFLQGIQSMKGTGTITEVEGNKAQAAITRMSTTTSEDEFRKAANEYKAIIDDAAMRVGSNIDAPVNIPPKAIDKLRKNPNLSLEFEQKYGVSAQRYIGK